jgi:hypothetical protein
LPLVPSAGLVDLETMHLDYFLTPRIKGASANSK